MNAMVYKGYAAQIEFDAQDEVFVGHVAGLNDIVGFHADTVEALKTAFREAVDDYLDACAKVGKPADKPFSGKVMFRIEPEIHAKAALAAHLQGKSLNQWAEDVLLTAARRDIDEAVAV